MKKKFIEGYSIKKFKEVRSQEDMNELIKLAGGFHDSVIKEIHIINEAFIDNSLSLICKFKYNLRLLVQRQLNNPSAVEFLFGDVYEMNLGRPEDIWGSSGEVYHEDLNESFEIKFELDDNKFKCRKFYYRFASEWMGQESRFGEEITLKTPKVIKELEEGWVICSTCYEAWESENRQILICPKCGTNHILEE